VKGGAVLQLQMAVWPLLGMCLALAIVAAAALVTADE
jgi:hypothetical protein